MVNQNYTARKKQKQNEKPEVGVSGHIYKSKKSGGDVKRHGKQDPYSYLPLRKEMLNKRSVNPNNFFILWFLSKRTKPAKPMHFF